MKTINSLIIMLVTFGFVACDTGFNNEITYPINEPITISKEEFRNKVKVTSAVNEISNYGKICLYNGFIYISEPEKGVHILDNSNPANPVMVGYIELPGNADLAIRNNLLYADSYIDLVWFDVSNPATPVLKGRLEEVFPEALPMPENMLGYDYELVETVRNKSVVIGWKVSERTEKVENYRGGWFWGFGNREIMSDATSGPISQGMNGSMSRFTLYDDKLYTVLNNYMSIFDLKPENPVKAVDNIWIGGNVETIFSYKNNMFMGTPTGMLIYSVANPLKPEYQSSISHAFGCDPVIVHNDIAYVTIHSGNNCGQKDNELIIVDVKDVKDPQHIESYSMTKPKGLAIDDEMLFLCDDGLKVYELATPKTITDHQLLHKKDMKGYDVIAHNKNLIMIAEEGLFQFNYADINNIYQVSSLLFKK